MNLVHAQQKLMELARLTSRRNPSARRSRSRGVRLLVESLEARQVPTGFMVTNLLTSGAGSLPAAVLQANADKSHAATVITFDPSLAGKTITLAAPLDLKNTTVGESIEIDAPAGGLVIDGGGTVGCFTVESGTTVTLKGLTIQHGHAYYGGGIENYGSLTVVNTTITGNEADDSGGGIDNWLGTLSVANSTISGNKADGEDGDGGGGINNFGPLTITGSTLSGNDAFGGGGGGVYNASTLTVIASTFASNLTAGFGGGLDSMGTLNSTGTTFTGNIANRGGGLFAMGTASVVGGTFLGNSASSGGGVENFGHLTVSSSRIETNRASVGGGLDTFTFAATILNATTVASNVSLQGAASDLGGVAVDGSSSNNVIGVGGGAGLKSGISGNQVGVLQVTSNSALATDVGSLPWAVAQASADRSGVPIAIRFDPALAGQTIRLTGTLELQNTTTGESIAIIAPAVGLTVAGGGAQSNFSVFTVDGGTAVSLNGLTIMGGHANFGGAIENTGTLSISNSTIVANTAVYAGGCIYNTSLGTLTATDSTFTGNLVTDLHGKGGAIENDGVLTLIRSTLTGNSAPFGGGGIETSTFTMGTTLLTNSTVAGNIAASGFDDLDGAAISSSSSGNLIRLGAGGLVDGINANVIGLRVTNTSDSAVIAGSLRWAVTQADGDRSGSRVVIHVDPSMAGRTISLGASLDLNNSTTNEVVEIDGPAGGVIIAGGGAASNFSALLITQGTSAVLDGVTISNGHTAASGGAILNAGTLVIRNSTLRSNSAAKGGAIFNSGNLSVINTAIRGNTASSAGPGIVTDNGGTSSEQFLVTSVSNAGSVVGSLPWAVAQADADQSGMNVVINFDAAAGHTFATIQTINLAGTLDLDNTTAGESVEIDAPAAGLALSGGGKVRDFTVEQGTTALLSGLTIRDGHTTASGAGVDNYGALSIQASTFAGDAAGYFGGAILNEAGGVLTIGNSMFNGNTATYGGAVSNSGTATIVNTQFAGNKTPLGNGGAINNYGIIDIKGGSFTGNAANWGGAMINWRTMTVTNASIAGNTATTARPGIDPESANTTVRFLATSTSNSSADAGSLPWAVAQADADQSDTKVLIALDSSLAGRTVTLSRTLDLQNLTPGESIEIDAPTGGLTISGGGAASKFSPITVESSTTVSLNGLTITGGHANFGGGITSYGSLSVSGCAINGNIADYGGGGIYSASGSLTVTNSTLNGNWAGYWGGGIEVLSTLNLTNCTISNNTANGAGGGGGGVYVGPITAMVTNSTFTGDVGAFGGAFDNTGNLTVTDSTIQANKAASQAPGIYDCNVPASVIFLVTNANAGGPGSLTSAVIRADADQSGTTAAIHFASSVAGQIIKTGATMDLSNTISREVLEIDAPAGGVTILGGGVASSYSVFHVEPSTHAILDGLTIRDGHTAASGGGVSNSGVLTIRNSSLVSNVAASFAGAVFNDSTGSLTVLNSNLSNNTAAYGGAISNSGTATVVNTQFAGNKTPLGNGGAINNYGKIDITGGSFTGNAANWGGAMINWGTMTVTNSALTGNTATTARPGIDPESANTTVRFLVTDTNASGDGSVASTLALADADQSGIATRLSFDPSVSGQPVVVATPMILKTATPGESFTIDAPPKGLTVETDGTDSNFFAVQVASGTPVSYNGTALTDGYTIINGQLLAPQTMPAAVLAKIASLNQAGIPLGPLQASSMDKILGGSVDFEAGSVCWSSATGAHFISGTLRDLWQQLNGPQCPLGLPTTDMLMSADGSVYVNFQNGFFSVPATAFSLVPAVESPVAVSLLTAADVTDTGATKAVLSDGPINLNFAVDQFKNEGIAANTFAMCYTPDGWEIATGPVSHGPSGVELNLSASPDTTFTIVTPNQAPSRSVSWQDFPAYSRLMNENYSKAVADSLAAHSATLEPIEAGTGNYSYDNFQVRVTLPPGLSPEEVLARFERDPNGTVQSSGFNLLADFVRQSQSDPAVGDIYDIYFPGPYNGAVVVTRLTPSYFDVATVVTPETGTHPIYGSREFGFEQNSDGTVTFYTRGADRVADAPGLATFAPPLQSTLWKFAMRGLADVIKGYGGQVYDDPSANFDYHLAGPLGAPNVPSVSSPTGVTGSYLQGYLHNTAEFQLVGNVGGLSVVYTAQDIYQTNPWNKVLGDLFTDIKTQLGQSNQGVVPVVQNALQTFGANLKLALQNPSTPPGSNPPAQPSGGTNPPPAPSQPPGPIPHHPPCPTRHPWGIQDPRGQEAMRHSALSSASDLLGTKSVSLLESRPSCAKKKMRPKSTRSAIAPLSRRFGSNPALRWQSIDQATDQAVIRNVPPHGGGRPEDSSPRWICCQ